MSATQTCRAIARAGLFVVLAVLGLVAAPRARADMMLLSQTNLVAGTQTSVASFTVTGPGSLSVNLSNIAWPQSLDSLSFMLSSSDEVVGAWSGSSSDSQSFDVGPGTYYAHVTGTAAGALNLGLYSINITFQPAGTVALPASGILLISGLLGVMFFLRSRRRSTPESAAATNGPVLVVG